MTTPSLPAPDRLLLPVLSNDMQLLAHYSIEIGLLFDIPLSVSPRPNYTSVEDTIPQYLLSQRGRFTNLKLLVFSAPF